MICGDLLGFGLLIFKDVYGDLCGFIFDLALMWMFDDDLFLEMCCGFVVIWNLLLITMVIFKDIW